MTDTAPDQPTDQLEADQPTEQPEADQPNPVLDELKQERRQRRELQKRLDDIEAAAESQRVEQLSDHERQLEEARTQARAEAMGEVQRQLAAARVEAAAAAAGFVDPSDATTQLELAGLDPEDDSAVRTAVAELAERKPYLLRGSVPSSAPAVPPGPVNADSDNSTFHDFLRQAVRGG
jgi:chromosome segregation ATPase